MDETTERGVITATVGAIRDACGERPVGWHTCGAASVNTRRQLLEDGGFLYDSDAYDDDLPRLATLAQVIMPYAFDTNDMRFAPGGGFFHGYDFARCCITAIDRLLAEGGRMLLIVLNLRIIGRAGRIGGLEAVLDRVLAADAAEGVCPKQAACCALAVFRQVCEGHAVVHQGGVDGGDDIAEKGAAVDLGVGIEESDVGKLGDLVDGQEHAERSLGQA